MNKKVLIGLIAAGAAIIVALAGIAVFIAYTLNYKPTSRHDVWDDDDDEGVAATSSFYQEDPTTTTRETQGRDYYENGGFKGWDNYYIIQDLTTEEIIGVYEYYHDLAHSYDINDLKDFDKELEYPAYSQVDASGLGVYMFYDLILPDEHIDHVVCFDAEGTGSTGAIEFSMKIRIHDEEKAMEIYNTFVERYSEGAIGSEYYDLMNTYDEGLRITVDESHDWHICYKKCRDGDNYYWLISVSEDN